MSNYYKRGDWNAICDTCGFQFKASKLRKNWKGLYVCADDWEPRHEQEFLRGRAEKQSTPWARPEPEDSFIVVCYLWERSCFADLAVADCAIADYQPLTYAQLLALKNGT